MILHADKLQLAYDQKIVVEQLSLTIPKGKICAILGPNGSGKSTVLRALSRLLKPQQGVVYLDGKRIQNCPTKQVARRLGMLPQQGSAPSGLTVRDLVTHGRFPHRSLLGPLTAADQKIVEQAMQRATIDHLADHALDQLSGGQRQLAWVAMSLAQDTEVLLLDEPTTFLDLAHQLEVLQVLEKVHQEKQATLVLVLHDINQAARYAEHLIVLQRGSIVAEGSPKQVITASLLESVFRVHAHIDRSPDRDVPYCVPLRVASAEDRGEG